MLHKKNSKKKIFQNKSELENKETQAFYLHAKKSLGQNFLKDENIISKIVSAIDSLFLSNNADKFVHEIGPGSGALTSQLLSRHYNVLGLEKDKRAIEGLTVSLKEKYNNKLFLHETDILKWNPNLDPCFLDQKNKVCVGNIPYYITSDILFWFIKHKSHYQHGIFMVQNEVADRIQAKPGTKDYGRLTVRLQLSFKVEKLFKVPALCFVPVPKVDSAIILLTPNEFQFSTQEEEIAFGSFTTVLFSARRKMLRRALHSHLLDFEQKYPGQSAEFWILAKTLGINEETRPDTLPPQTILQFHNFFWKYKRNA